ARTQKKQAGTTPIAGVAPAWRELVARESQKRPGGGLEKRPGNGSASWRRSTSKSVQRTFEPASSKKAMPITPTLRSSPFCAAYEPLTDPKRNAANSSKLRRKPSISTVENGFKM